MKNIWNHHLVNHSESCWFHTTSQTKTRTTGRHTWRTDPLQNLKLPKGYRYYVKPLFLRWFELVAQKQTKQVHTWNQHTWACLVHSPVADAHYQRPPVPWERLRVVRLSETARRIPSPKTNSSLLKLGHPKRKESYSKHLHFQVLYIHNVLGSARVYIVRRAKNLPTILKPS